MKKLLFLLLFFFMISSCSFEEKHLQSNILTLIKNNNALDLFSLINTKKISLDHIFSNGQSMLHMATENSQNLLIGSLVEEGASLDIQDSQGNTALMALLASKNFNITTFKTLMDLQPNINIQNKAQETALILALLNDHFQAFSILLKNNPTLTLKDKHHKTIFDYANQKLRDPYRALLQKRLSSAS